MRLLVVGGAGYIGSHMVKMLHERGCAVTTYDNLSSGFRDAVRYGTFVLGDVSNRKQLDELFTGSKFDLVMHFASHIRVDESVVAPEKYYENNLVGTLNLLAAMKAAGVTKLVFSSSAAVFGAPRYLPIDEAHPKSPMTAYGRSKWMVEAVLEDYARAHNLKSVSLRYFNAAGADPSCELGERHDPETHLIPLVLKAASGARSNIHVFGRDYDTPDGTCIRDYVHVSDLCEAHWLAVKRLTENGGCAAYNLGNGQGFSVQEVIDVARQLTGRQIRVIDAPRREGDPPRLVADSGLANRELGWRPQYGDLETIIRHAWSWELNSAGCLKTKSCN